MRNAPERKEIDNFRIGEINRCKKSIGFFYRRYAGAKIDKESDLKDTEEYHEKQYTGPGRRQDSQSEG